MTEFITRNYGNKEYEIIIKTDSKGHYEATEEFARRLIDHAKPQTNADRIRAMSDEDFATFLEHTGTAGCPGPVRRCMASCYACILDWLQQPAEVE